jgi:hypothetical protein
MIWCQAPPKKIPRTLENTREADETIVNPSDEEVIEDEAEDEFSNYFDGKVTPKILITTSTRPSHVIRNNHACLSLNSTCDWLLFRLDIEGIRQWFVDSLSKQSLSTTTEVSFERHHSYCETATFHWCYCNQRRSEDSEYPSFLFFILHTNDPSNKPTTKKFHHDISFDYRSNFQMTALLYFDPIRRNAYLSFTSWTNSSFQINQCKTNQRYSGTVSNHNNQNKCFIIK